MSAPVAKSVSTVARSISTVARSQSVVLPADRRRKRMSPKRRFRAFVRFVIANLPWLLDESEVKPGTKVYNLKKSMKSRLSRELKFILHKSAEERTPEENSQILKFMRSMKRFRKYPDNVMELLASHCHFAYYGANRVIIRKNHHATAIYYMVSGQLNIVDENYDAFLDETEYIVLAPVAAGEACGEISLLHDLPRLRSIISITPVEFLVLLDVDFDLCLRKNLQAQWDYISLHMLTFDYFKTWNNLRLSQCCMVSVIHWFKKDETVLGDGCGFPNYVHFVLHGNCVLIEDFQVQPHKLPSGKCVYTRAPPELFTQFGGPNISAERVSLSRRSIRSQNDIDDAQVRMSRYTMSTEVQRVSIQTQLQTTNWTEYSRRMSERRLQTVFMQVCRFGYKSCFSLGEPMQNRRVIAEDDLVILLIPAYLLLGRDMIWSRIKQFLTKRIPSSDMVFERFQQQREYQRYKNDAVKPLLNRYCTNWYSNIPYSTRVRSDFEFRTTK